MRITLPNDPRCKEILRVTAIQFGLDEAHATEFAAKVSVTLLHDAQRVVGSEGRSVCAAEWRAARTIGD